MDQPACHMDQTRRDAVLQAIQEVCGDRGWNLLAAHVRSHPVHTVVEAEAEPERHGRAHDGCRNHSTSPRPYST